MRYEGLCVGGPANGETHWSSRPHLEIAVMLPLNLSDLFREVTMNDKGGEIHNYLWSFKERRWIYQG